MVKQAKIVGIKVYSYVDKKNTTNYSVVQLGKDKSLRVDFNRNVLSNE